ncbi:MAG: ferrous iron transport protein A [Clostridia bacterium]|nr:ferrous iron transport protein A [Clostridia bacterium]MBO5777157.1 ferrous iron transport protein A [Clostridia bacterium]MBO5983318.1 ferrous iron transport protein A [Clostridia bacterium]MBO7151616.1 ferrous iron transport protein A [Clostridia bacterium]
MKQLSEFTIGERGVVKMVDGDRRIRRRLFDMGVTPGAEIMLRKKAPLGDPIEVSLRGYELTLRKTEAEFVTMERI